MKKYCLLLLCFVTILGWSQDELSNKMKDSVLVSSMIIGKVLNASNNLILENVHVVNLNTVKGTLTNFIVRTVKGMVPKYNLANTVTFKEALAQGKKFTLPDLVGKPEDVIVLQYTGGTTGVAKGAMLTNSNLLHNHSNKNNNKNRNKKQNEKQNGKS